MKFYEKKFKIETRKIKISKHKKKHKHTRVKGGKGKSNTRKQANVCEMCLAQTRNIKSNVLFINDSTNVVIQQARVDLRINSGKIFRNLQKKMTQKPDVMEDDKNDDCEEFILIRVPKTIDPSTLNGTKIYLNRNDDRPNEIRSSSSSGDDQTYGYNFTAINNNNQLAFYSMNKIQPEILDKNNVYRLDRNTRLKGCLNFYQQPSPLSSIETNESELQPLESECPNDPVDKIIHRNKRKFLTDQNPIIKSNTIVEDEQPKLRTKKKSRTK